VSSSVDASGSPRLGRLRRTGHLLGPSRVSGLYLLAVIFAVFGAWIPGEYFSTSTFRVVGSTQVVTILIGLALLVPFTAGAFDLSAGYMVDFSLVITARLVESAHFNVWIAALVALACCSLAGLVSGIITVRFNVNSFIATIGVGQILAALTLYISQNQEIAGIFPASFEHAGQAEWFGIPCVVYYLIVVAAVLWYILEWTPLGRNLRACGANPEAARLVGVRTGNLVVGSLVGSALIAGLAGIVLGAQIGVFQDGAGPPLLFPAFAAIFFGSTQFLGRPNVWGTVVTAYVLAFGVEGLQLVTAGDAYWVTPLFDGVALLIAVVVASRSPSTRSRLRRIIPKLGRRSGGDSAPA
jgi:ribose transport system permease protein